MGTKTVVKRVGNKRGFGGELRTEILEAAERLLSSQASSEAVTLRAIAREAGIAAPSIYPHFPDRDAILDVVVGRAFDRLAELCATAAESAPAGIKAVQAMSVAYVRFAREHPGQYRILFERSSSNISSPPRPYREGIRAFDVLVQTLRSTETAQGVSNLELIRDAQTLFAALHGIAVLRPALPGFPWQDEGTLIENAVAHVCDTPQSGPR
ncbi:TetR/AcrR family transcriptional regulator [Glaciihabitans sp. dw_435]|uniref:TetR/AcrR family transcriptional regulator n=1 Tax=Glaciihabitans sp. dw_435 TaxID=2720081 RepID=UPI001BD4A05E|nr:TetR/AcrR family transcriptional regulator [Glaciihabitans sp. dw_435]